MIDFTPRIATQAGTATGGGFIDSIKQQIAEAKAGAAGGATPAKSDGSIGLFDGVMMKAGIGSAVGSVAGAILPFGFMVGGLVGAVGGAAIGMYGNWRKMNAIKQQNDAAAAALGVQTDDPQIKQILQTGQVQQLVPIMTQGLTPTAATQVDPAATQMAVDPNASAQQSPVPQQAQTAVGAGAYNPAVGVDPGVAPALQGGGAEAAAAAPAARPPAAPPPPPGARQGAGVEAVAPGLPTSTRDVVEPGQPTSTRAIVEPGLPTPQTAGAGANAAQAATDATEGVAAVGTVATPRTPTGAMNREQAAAMVAKLHAQLEEVNLAA